jgi:hypothetical protein
VKIEKRVKKYCYFSPKRSTGSIKGLDQKSKRIKPSSINEMLKMGSGIAIAVRQPSLFLFQPVQKVTVLGGRIACFLRILEWDQLKYRFD